VILMREMERMTVKGTYKGKPIRAVLLEGTTAVKRFEYVDEPGIWYFPLIEDGGNMERDKFVLEVQHEAWR